MNRFQSTKWFWFHIKVLSWYWADCFGSKNLRSSHSLLCDIFQMCVRLLNSHYEECGTRERDNRVKWHEIWELDATFRHWKLNCERGCRGIVKCPVLFPRPLRMPRFYAGNWDSQSWKCAHTWANLPCMSNTKGGWMFSAWVDVR